MSTRKTGTVNVLPRMADRLAKGMESIRSDLIMGAFPPPSGVRTGETLHLMVRDPNTKGCGIGEVDPLVRTLGGKCGDIHSVYIALAKVSGVPSREVWGIRIPAGKGGDMTKAQHCWAEWYSPGYGWVVVDPADVRKAILEKRISLEQAKPRREYYFGAVDESRIAVGTGRDLILNPPQAGEPLNYFMYPYAEADGKPLNEDLYGFNLGYKITFREL